MPFDNFIQNKIIEAIKKKANGYQPVCSICGQHEFKVSDHFATILTTKQATYLNLNQGFLPCAPLSCTNCGNTYFVNLLMLGFTEEDLKFFRCD